MKLSEAIMLGATTVKMEPCDINSCAYGAAMNALGVPKDTFFSVGGSSFSRYKKLGELWPWTRNSIGGFSALGRSVYDIFDHKVCSGEMTLEQLVDYVRSIEPDCGECNRFECTCTKTPAAEEITEAVRA